MSEVTMNQEPQETSQPQQSQQSLPQNYLVFAILATIFCCWPLGIPAIIFAAQVNSKFTQGDFAGAEESSKKAKMFSFIAMGAGILAIIIYMGFMLLGAIVGAAN